MPEQTNACLGCASKKRIATLTEAEISEGKAVLRMAPELARLSKGALERVMNFVLIESRAWHWAA